MSIDSYVNKVFNKHPDKIPDIGYVEYNRRGSKMEELVPICEPFCDSVIFHCPCNYLSVSKGKSPEAGIYIAIVRAAFKDTGVIHNIKPVSTGYDEKHNVIPLNAHELSKGNKEDYSYGYVSLKVSVMDTPIKRIASILQDKIASLNEKLVFLESLDITKDFKGNITRDEVKIWLMEYENVSVVKDERKVGKNCISWTNTYDGIRIRNKGYNKLVQMYESPSVRSYLGSLIPDLVVPSESFRDRLMKAKSHGLTRLECTIYFGEIQDHEWYISVLEEAQNTLRGCPVYMTSFENQWKELADKIVESASTCAIYDYNRQIFAYCHWYNSVTGKKQGYAKEGVKESDIPWLLAAYSFNNVPIHYIRFNIDENGEYAIESTVDYMRVSDTGTSITLVPGVQKSLYPSFKVVTGIYLQFRDVGIVEHKGINVGWPEMKIDKRSKSLAVLKLINPSRATDLKSQRLQELVVTKTSLFKAGYSLLNPNTTYKVISIGRKEYRGRMSIFATLTSLDDKHDDNTVHVRAGPSLESIIIENEQRGRPFLIRTGDVRARDIIVENVPII